MLFTTALLKTRDIALKCKIVIRNRLLCVVPEVLCVQWCSFSALSELKYHKNNTKSYILLQGDFNDAKLGCFCFDFYSEVRRSERLLIATANKWRKNAS